MIRAGMKVSPEVIHPGKITDWCEVRDHEVRDKLRQGWQRYREYRDSYNTVWVELVKYGS